MQLIRRPKPGKVKMWVYFGKSNKGNLCGESLFLLVSSTKRQFRWRLPESNPYFRDEVRSTASSRYRDVEWLLATIKRRAGYGERCMSGSGRRGWEIARLRLVSYSTLDGTALDISLLCHLPGREVGSKVC